MRIDEAEWQLLNLRKSIIADIPDNLKGHLVVAKIHQPLAGARDHCTADDFQYDSPNSVKIHLSFSDHVVDGTSGQLRDIQRQQNGHNRQDQGQVQIDSVPANVPDNPRDRCLLA